MRPVVRGRPGWALAVLLPSLAVLASGCRTGERCRVDDAEYQDGATGIPALDGCNTCQCQHGQLACTMMACPGHPCVVGATSYVDGATGIPAPDGCNTCQCQDGQLACTAMPCTGRPCVIGDAVYGEGATIPAGDGCNSCVCMDGTFACTLAYCPKACDFEGTTIPDGDSICACEWCGEIFGCSAGSVWALECVPGMPCREATGQAECYCSTQADGRCPFRGICDGVDPDCPP